jgi:hypothetical protein
MAAIMERNGRYKVIYNYVDEDGNRRQKWETFQTLPEAKRRKLELEWRSRKNTINPKCQEAEEKE